MSLTVTTLMTPDNFSLPKVDAEILLWMVANFKAPNSILKYLSLTNFRVAMAVHGLILWKRSSDSASLENILQVVFPTAYLRQGRWHQYFYIARATAQVHIQGFYEFFLPDLGFSERHLVRKKTWRENPH
jgi:hypothetical protein